MSHERKQVVSYPNILQNIRDLMEFHAYMRNPESLKIAYKLHGPFQTGTRIHTRTEICTIYLELCSKPVENEMATVTNGEDDDNSSTSSSGKVIAINEYSPENWEGVYEDLEELRSHLLNGVCLLVLSPPKPHKLLQNLVNNRANQETDDISVDEERQLTEEQASIVGKEFDDQLESTLFQQALSNFRRGDFSTDSVILFKNFLDKRFEESSIYYELLLDLLDGNISSLKLKSKETMLNMFQSKPYSLSTYQKSMTKFLSRLENTMLPVPFLIQLGYSRNKQPGYINDFVSEQTQGVPAEVPPISKQSEIELTNESESEATHTQPYRSEEDDSFEDNRKKSALPENVEDGNNEAQVKAARKELKDKRGKLAKHKDPLDDIINASNKCSIKTTNKVVLKDSANEETVQTLDSTNREEEGKQSTNASERDSIDSRVTHPVVQLSGVASRKEKSKSPEKRSAKAAEMSPGKRKKRGFTDVEDRAIIDGLRRFDNELNIWAAIRDYYVVFSGKYGYGERTSVQIKDRFRTLMKLRDARIVVDEETGDYDISALDDEDIPESTTSYRLRMQSQ